MNPPLPIQEDRLINREGLLFWDNDQYSLELRMNYNTPIIDVKNHHLYKSYSVNNFYSTSYDPNNDNVLIYLIKKDPVEHDTWNFYNMYYFEVIYNKEEDVIERMHMFSDMYKRKGFQVVAIGYSSLHPLPHTRQGHLLQWYDCCVLFDPNICRVI